MSVHPAFPRTDRRGSGLRAMLAGMADRLIASPLDSTVLLALAAQAPAAPPARIRPRRQAVTANDGSRARGE